MKPAIFMENLPYYLKDDQLLTAYNPDVKLPLTAVRDIGNAAASAIRDPQKFHAVELDLASDYLTILECADALSKAWGRKIEAPAVPVEKLIALGFHPKMVQGHEWFNEYGVPARPALAEAYGLTLTSLHEWAVRNRA